MTQPLLFDARLMMTKVAFSVRLTEDAEQWPTEIVKEAYKQVPCLQGMETDLELDKVDGERGFAIGKMLVFPMGMKKDAAIVEKKLITMPIIVRDREMSPIDVFAHLGVMYSVSEEKIASILTVPSTFGDPIPVVDINPFSLGNQITPPGDGDGYGMPSVTRSLWKGASVTFRKNDIDAFAKGLRDDVALRNAVLGNDWLAETVGELQEHKEKTAADLHTDRLAAMKPDTMQVVELGNGYIVKTARSDFYNVLEKRCSRFDVEKMLTPEQMQTLLKEGSITVTTNPVSQESTPAPAQVASKVGTYDVITGTTKISGVIVPRVVTFDGRVLESQLFVGEKVHAMQEKVAAFRKGDAEVGCSEEPRGLGVFVYQKGDQGFATEPIKVAHKVTRQTTDTSYAATLMQSGEEVSVYVVPSLQKLARMGRDIFVPETMKWLPLPGDSIHLSEDDILSDTVELKKTAVSQVEVISDGDTFSFRGEHAKAFPSMMERSEARFALAALGVDGEAAESILKTAARSMDSVLVRNTRPVVAAGERETATLTKVASAFAKISEVPRVNLVREAAFLASKECRDLCKTAGVVLGKDTVDAVLALGFITPENVSVYVDYIPELEKTATKLAEILMASRLGMDEVRENAAKSALNNVETVIDGLRKIQNQIS